MQKKSAYRIAAAALVLAVSCTAAFMAAAQGNAAPKAELKTLVDNDKVRVIELHYKPGAENANVPRDARVVRALTSGTLQRIYADGKKEDVKWKAGEARFYAAATADAPQYTTKNVGKSELALYLVILK